MGAVKVHTWKELAEQAEIAKKSAKKFERSVPKNKWRVNTKGRDAAQSSQLRGKETIVVELSRTTQSKQKSNTNDNQEFKFPPKAYSFKDEQMVAIFHLLHKSNELKLPEAQRPNEVGHATDPNYYLFHRMVHHPTSRYYILKDKIQALIDAGVLTLKSE